MNKEEQNRKKEFDGYAYWMDGDSFGGAWFICDTNIREEEPRASAGRI